jgi:hypothetical protein
MESSKNSKISLDIQQDCDINASGWNRDKIQLLKFIPAAKEKRDNDTSDMKF